MLVIKANIKVLIATREQDTGEKLTYERLSEGTGLSRHTIRRLAENQTARVDLTTLDKLCKFFNCDVGDLLYYVPNE